MASRFKPLIKAFEQAITPKTKILHITHIINWVGQILPVKKICQMAHRKGLEVIVDGAHSFGFTLLWYSECSRSIPA